MLEPEWMLARCWMRVLVTNDHGSDTCHTLKIYLQIERGAVFLIETVFRETKIDQFQVSRSIDEEIVRFEVAMDVTHFVQGVHGQQHFCEEEFGVLFRETADLIEQRLHITTWNVFLNRKFQQRLTSELHLQFNCDFN